MINERLLLGVIILGLLLIIAWAFTVYTNPRVNFTPANGGGLPWGVVGKPILVSRLIPVREGFLTKLTVGQKSYDAVIDTGSPMINIPNSLPCDSCKSTGGTPQPISYGSGQRDKLFYSQALISVGGASPRLLTFGGTTATALRNAPPPILGLSPKPPSADPLQNASIISNLGVGRLILSLKETAPTMTMFGRGSTFRINRSYISLPLVTDSYFLTLGSLMYYYAVLGSIKQIPQIQMFALDTGCTCSQIPAQYLPPGLNPSSDTLSISLGNQYEVLLKPSEYSILHDSSIPSGMAILGLSWLRGKTIVFDLVGGMFHAM